MSFKVIKGTFHVVGYSPDGDSIRFKADNPASWETLSGRKVRLNAKGHAQLRIEAIDTLETHYKSEHQPKQYADAATTYLFKLLGIKNVVWNASGSKVTAADDGVSGYIVARAAERNGRPVSFVFSGKQQFNDGEDIFLDKVIARKSVNYKMLAKGYAYPTFYDGMFYDLRELFAKKTKKVRSTKSGVWKKDVTNDNFAVTGLESVTDQQVMLPKLFRRITAYIKKNGSFDANDFIKQMEKSPEKVLVLSILHFTHFDNLISVNNKGKIKLRHKPENLVFLG